MYFSCAWNQSRQSISKRHGPTKTKESFVLSLNYETWKPQDKHMKGAKCKFKWNFIKKRKKITPIWCKVIPKIDVVQIKDNMREIIFIYILYNLLRATTKSPNKVLLGTYFKKKFKPTQDVSNCLKSTQNISN